MRRSRLRWGPEPVRALNLDFRRREHSASWAGAALLAAALAAGAASGRHYLQLEQQLAAAEAQMRDAKVAARKNTAASVHAGEPQVQASELKQAGEILHQLTLPWGELFASAESVGTPDVALLSIESDTDKRRVKISGEAKNLEAILAYLRYLESKPALMDVYLQSHELQKQDAQQPVRFVLNAQWRVRN